MNPWVQRALISLAGSAVTTAVVITTAKQPNKKKKKKKPGKGKDGVTIEEEVPRSAGAQAAHDYRSGHDGGLTNEEFVENVKGSGKRLQAALAYLGGGIFGGYRSEAESEEAARLEGEPDEILGVGESAKEAPKKANRKAPPPGARPYSRKRVKVKGKRRPRGEKAPPRRRRPGPKPKSDFEAIRDEAMKAAASKLAAKTGAGEIVENLKDTGSTIREKASEWGGAISDRVPEDFGDKVGETLESAQKGLSGFGKKVGATLKDVFDEHDWSSADGAQSAVDRLSSKVDRDLELLQEELDKKAADVVKADEPLVPSEVVASDEPSVLEPIKREIVDAVVVDAVVEPAESTNENAKDPKA